MWFLIFALDMAMVAWNAAMYYQDPNGWSVASGIFCGGFALYALVMAAVAED